MWIQMTVLRLRLRIQVPEIVTYGAPVLPGAMFLLSYYGEKKRPVIGLPGCVMYAERTILFVLPRSWLESSEKSRY